MVTRSLGKQTNKDKPDTKENKQSALNDKTTVNDDGISSGNSIHFIIILLLFLLLFFFFYFTFLVSLLFLFMGIPFLSAKQHLN